MKRRIHRVAARSYATNIHGLTANTRIGWIGTGVMGTSMCGHLIDAGYKTTIYNRTVGDKVRSLEVKGARVVGSPKEVAENCDVLFTIVGFPTDVESVLLDRKQGALHSLAPSSIVVDMTTSTPQLAQRVDSTAQKLGLYSLDCPVSGGDIGAKNKKLSIMCGGSETVFNGVKPLLDELGNNVQYMGTAGAGQHTKMVNQILIASNMMGVVEGLMYGRKAGLDLEKVITAVGGGAAGSWSVNNLGIRIIKGDYEPGFFVEHFIKDLGIALEESHKMGLQLPGLTAASKLYKQLQTMGYGRKGTQALMKALEQANNTTF